MLDTVMTLPVTARRRKIGGSGNAVRDHTVLAARQAPDAFDRHRALARPADFRAAGIQKIGKVADFRLPRRIVDHGRAPGKNCCNENVFGRADARERKGNYGTVQPVRDRTVQTAVVLPDHDAHPAQGRKMKVDRPRPKLTAARIGKLRFPHFGNNGTEKNDRRTHFAHQIVRNITSVHRERVDDDISAGTLHAAAEVAKNALGRVHIRQRRAIM